MRQLGGEDPESTQTDPKSSDGKRSNNKRKRFGLMPRILHDKFKERVQSSDGQGSSHNPSRFVSMPEIMKDKSKDRVGDHGSRREMEGVANETGMANQSTNDNVENETFYTNPENIAQDKHSSSSSHLSFDDYSYFQWSLMCAVIEHSSIMYP